LVVGNPAGLGEALDDEAGFGELGAPPLEGLGPPPHVPPALPGVLEELGVEVAGARVVARHGCPRVADGEPEA
jgi:hypothetical protein